MTSPIKVIVADDHALFRRGLVDLLKEEPGFFLVGEASNGREALNLCLSLQPDIVLMDVHMPVLGGLEAVEEIKAKTNVQVLMLTVSENDRDLLGAIQAGADGYVLKNIKPNLLCEAIRQVVAGHSVLSPEVTAVVMNQASRRRPPGPKIQLSPRESEILVFLSQGANTNEIASALVISTNTVKTHVRRLLKKLEAGNRVEAVAQAAALGLLDQLP